MKTKKLLLTATIQSILFTVTPVLAGDVEVSLPAASDAFTIDQPAGTELMRVNGEGNVGIGTDAPSDGTTNGGQALKLDVEGAIGATSYCDENGENCQTILQLNSAGGGKFVDGTDTNDAVYTTGNVGVGTAEPGGQLHVAASGTIIPFMTDSADGSASWWVHNSYRSSQYGPTLAFRKHHATKAAPEAITTNSRIQEIHAQGYDGTTLVGASSIVTVPTEDWTASNHGSRMDIYAGSPATGGKISLLSTGSVGVGTLTPSDASGSGGQALKLDVEGAVGASHYCDENGENCQTAASLVAGNAGTAMAFKVTSTDTATTQPRGTDWKMDTEWEVAPEINTFSNSTFANGTFTVGAGEGGLYEIFARVNVLGDEGRDRTIVHVNGAVAGLSSISTGSSTSLPSSAYVLANLSAGDTVEVYSNYEHSTADRSINCTAGSCYLTLQKIGAAATGGGVDNLGSHIATQDIDLAANKLVGNGGAEGIAIDAAGNVGIGVATPVFPLDIAGNTQIGGSLFFKNPAAPADNQRWWLRNSEADGSLMLQALMDVGNGGGGGNTVRFTRSDNNIAQSQFLSSGNPFAVFDHNNQRVGVGTANPVTPLHVVAADNTAGVRVEATSGEIALRLMPKDAAAGDISEMMLTAYRTSDGEQDNASISNTEGSLVLSGHGNSVTNPHMVIANSGNVGIGTTTPASALHVVGTITETSDERLKEDIRPIENALEKIMLLEGVSFQWKAEAKQEKGVQIGLIAQHVEKAVPEVVKTAEDEQSTKSVAYSNLVALLIEGMKAQQKRIEALEAKLQQ